MPSTARPAAAAVVVATGAVASVVGVVAVAVAVVETVAVAAENGAAERTRVTIVSFAKFLNSGEKYGR